jgi:hypothetical protein
MPKFLKEVIFTCLIAGAGYAVYRTSFSDHMFQDEDVKRENEQKFFNELKFSLTYVTIEQGKSDVVLTGNFDERQATIKIDPSFGGIQTSVAVKSKVSTLYLRYSLDGEKELMEGATRAPDSSGKIDEFLSSHVFISAKPKKIDKQKALLDELPEDLLRLLLDYVTDSHGGVSFGRKQLSIRMGDVDVSASDAVQLTKENLALSAELAGAVEAAWGTSKAKRK